MRSWSILLCLAVLGAVLAGCADDAGTDDVAVDPLPPLRPQAFVADCPAGETQTNDAGLCVGRIASRTESNQEPYVAVDPARPSVIAIGVNAGHTVGAPRAVPRPGADLVLLDIFVSEDGGATWRLSELPYVADEAVSVGPADVSVVGDPALAFDGAGVLHVSGIASHANAPFAGRGYNVFYTQSADLGRTWSQPVVLTADDDNDRNWMDIGPDGTLYVAWQNVGDSSEVAWSTDGGATWTTQEAGQKAKECLLPGRLTFVDGAPLLACGGFGQSGFTGVRPHRLDLATGALVELAEIPEMPCIGAQPLAPQPGLLVILSAWCDGPAKLATSRDGGATWAVQDLATATGLDAGWLYWSDVDAWGNVHALVGVAEDVGSFLGAGERVHHVAFDPATGQMVSSQELRGPNSAFGGTDSVAPDYGDHFYGLAFAGEEAFAVWTHDRGLDYARIVPLFPDAALAAATDGEAGGDADGAQ